MTTTTTTTGPTELTPTTCPVEEDKPALVTIAGAGIVGLVLALALEKHLGLIPEVYERESGFPDDVGAGMGMYTNGLRVLRDIDENLLRKIQQEGRPYVARQWERHDGTIIMSTSEKVLSRNCNDNDSNDDNDDDDAALSSMGIQRWKLQKLLLEAVQAKGIPIYFGKETVDIEPVGNDGSYTDLIFADGTKRRTLLLFAADGGKSMVRRVIAPKNKLEYTGVTCLMGISESATAEEDGIRFPSATTATTQCHGAFFPTGEKEVCFQFHFPIGADCTDQESWGSMSKQMTQDNCQSLATMLRKDGWHERYLEPLEHVHKAVKVGFCLLKPRLKHWVYNNRIVLLGDAAHPPVPYTGQGAQQGLEDAGSIALLLKHYCLNEEGKFEWSPESFQQAMQLYERLRIPHTSEILDASKHVGRMQAKRTEGAKMTAVQEERIQRQVFYHETLPQMFPGATHNYKYEIEKTIHSKTKA